MKGVILVIYFDSAAGTKPYQEVVEVMSDVMLNRWGNASSNNSFGDDARNIVEIVREQFAKDLNCKPEEIIFTGSGCEANSLAIMGFIKNNPSYDYWTTKLEHASINELANHISSETIYNDKCGLITHKQVDDILAKKYTRPFVSMSMANSEIGVIQRDIKNIASVVHQYSGKIHCDATQLFPETRIDVKELDIDMLSLSAQKFHGPRGVGLLYVKNGVRLSPIVYGSQEGGARGGTYNTAAIAGMGKALEITRNNNKKTYVKTLRDVLLNKLLDIPNVHLNGPKQHEDCRLSNNISLTIDDVNAERLVTLCDLHGLIIAKGSACQSHEPKPSKALLAIGLTKEQALNTIRITLDEFNTKEEVDQAAKIITALVERIRMNNDY